MPNADAFLIYSGILLSSFIVIFFVVCIILDFFFTRFKRVECEIEHYSVYPVLPIEKKNDIKFFNLRITYTYQVDGKIYSSTRLNHLNSIGRSKKSNVEQLLTSRLTNKGTIYAYVCPHYHGYSILFPLKFHFGVYGSLFVLTSVILACFFYGLNSFG